jgi:hypothetical protein
MTKKEAVPTSCWFEKPAAGLKDYFCWLTQFLWSNAQSLVFVTHDTNQFDGWQKTLSISKGKIKNKLLKLLG